jgi:hypothetical protein
MKHRLSCAFVAALFLSALSCANGQVSAYGTVAATNYGYSFNGDSLRTGGTYVGYGLGGYYNFPIQSRLTAGIDVRGSVSPRVSGGEKAFVSGRFGFVPTRFPLRPYVQFGGGVIRTKGPAFAFLASPQTVTHGALDLALGLDVRITHDFDWRALELESGAGVGSSSSSASASISTGVVYHFHPRS